MRNSKKSEIRKCSICKQDIDITDNSIDFFFSVTGQKNKVIKCTHTDCYIDYATSLKRNSKTVDECMKYIDECKETTKLKERKDRNKHELYDFLMDFYEISYLPKYFYVKMDSVYKGEYRGLNKKISPEDLLDMWKQKKNYLQKVAERNKKKENEIDGIARIWYDLSILLSKYDSYLLWKEQQKIALANHEEEKNKNIEFINYDELVKNQKNIKNNSSNKIDISSILDEI